MDYKPFEHFERYTKSMPEHMISPSVHDAGTRFTFGSEVSSFVGFTDDG